MALFFTIGIHLKLLEMVCGNSRKEIPGEVPGICTLVHVNKDYYDVDISNSLDDCFDHFLLSHP